VPTARAAQAPRHAEGRLIYPKVQILTFAELFEGKRPQIPLVDTSYFKKAHKETTSQQGSLI
jgi:hypothetical protein